MEFEGAWIMIGGFLKQEPLFSEYGQNAWLNCLEGEYEDLFTGEKLEMNSVWMNPYQYRWCVKK